VRPGAPREGRRLRGWGAVVRTRNQPESPRAATKGDSRSSGAALVSGDGAAGSAPTWRCSTSRRRRPRSRPRRVTRSARCGSRPTPIRPTWKASTRSASAPRACTARTGWATTRSFDGSVLAARATLECALERRETRGAQPRGLPEMGSGADPTCSGGRASRWRAKPSGSESANSSSGERGLRRGRRPPRAGPRGGGHRCLLE
jgi:hypothetical protein